MQQLNGTPERRVTDPRFGDLLRSWRAVRRLSQLALAAEANVSARHVAFLETGRSRPSREMVRQLARALDIPLAEQNTLLLSAGYAPLYGEQSIDAPDLEPVRRALEFMLAKQEPYPAVVVDGSWNVRMRNRASERVFGSLRRYYEVDAALLDNAMHTLCHPRGLRPFIVNWREFASPLLQGIHREAVQGLNPEATRLRGELLRYPDVAACLEALDPPGCPAPLLAMRLLHGDVELSLFTTITAFAMPRDVTLQQTRIESFFPADVATADALARLADGRRLPAM